MAGENDNNTILAEKCSQDGGHTWQNYRRISKIDEGFGRSHGVYFSYEKKLYAFCPKASFDFDTYVNLKTEAYVMNDKGEYECLGVILDDSFWPLCEPIVLDDGSLIMAGINATGWPPKGYGLPAVALCDGKDITMWEVKNLPDPNSICFWGETAVLKQRKKLIAIVRNNGRKCALTSESTDGGKTWSNLVESNLPILDSKVYAGMLSNGKQYIVFNMQERGYRETLVIAVGTDTFDKVYIIRDGFDAPPKFWQNNEWCYPYAYEDIDNNKLLVVYAKNKEDCELAIIPIENL